MQRLLLNGELSDAKTRRRNSSLSVSYERKPVETPARPASVQMEPTDVPRSKDAWITELWNYSQ